jgi:threonine dehydratase
MPVRTLRARGALAPLLRGVASLSADLPLTLAHVAQARERLRAARVPCTPILRSPWVDERTGVNVHFKCEHLQDTGSFKLRGATNAVLALSVDASRSGIVAHSSGNHGAGCASAAKRRGVPCAIIVPHTTPASKIDNMKRFGSDVILCEPTQRSRSEVAAGEAARRGATLVHPYNDPLVIAGQGTIGMELAEQVPQLDAVLVPTSGGGMVTGIAVALKAKLFFLFSRPPLPQNKSHLIILYQIIVNNIY